MASLRVRLRQFRRRLALAGGVKLAVRLLAALRLTWHVQRIGDELFRSKGIIVAFWHGDLLIGATEAMRVRRTDFATLTSRSRDGEIAATLASALGITPLRGGSSRGQVEALRAMERWLRAQGSILLAVDGPRGPQGVVKSGVVLLAAYTGAPIVPAAATSSPRARYEFRSWDRMWIPKPFARFVITYDMPIHVPRHVSRDELEAYRRRLEERLFHLHGLRRPPDSTEAAK